MELNMRVNNFNRVRELDTATEEMKRVGTMNTSHTILKTATTYVNINIHEERCQLAFSHAQVTD